MTELIHRFKPFILLLAIMMLVQLINSLTNYSLLHWGVLPRTLSGLWGVPFSPFLHGSWQHLLNNILVLIPLSVILLLRSAQEFWLGSLFIIIGGGLTLWLMGRDAYHVGASGWVFGLWGLLLANAWFRLSLGDLLCAVVVLFYFGSIWIGLLPANGISFEGHIFGVVWGVLFAWLYYRLERRGKLWR